MTLDDSTMYMPYMQSSMCDFVCGPWVGDDGQLSTHTRALYGPIEKVFTAEVRINFEGVNVMIAHLRVGNIQIALGKEISVIPRKGESSIVLDVCTNACVWLRACGERIESDP